MAEPSGFGGSMNGAWDRVTAAMPELNDVYLEPLDPQTEMSLSDRLSLIWQSTAPWAEFFDISKYNRPQAGEIRERVSHNLGTYFYNYFFLACLHILLFSLGHLGTFLVLASWIGAMSFLFSREGDVDILGKVTLDERGKQIVAVVTGGLITFFGGVATLLISLSVFLIIVVGIHCLVRDNTADTV